MNGGRPLNKKPRQVNKKLFPRQPTKKDLELALVRWGTKGNFTEAQSQKQAYPQRKRADLDTRQFVASIDMYMSKFALRAPAMPPKMRNLETGSSVPTLWRGMSVDEEVVDATNSFGGWHMEGYAAFSRHKNAAIMYGTGTMTNSKFVRNSVIVLFRLLATDVQRGTPWVWFTGKDDLARNRTVLSGLDTNQEVLLPPGFMRFKGPPRVSTVEFTKFKKRMYTFDITYEPVSTPQAAWVALKAVMKFKAGGRAAAARPPGVPKPVSMDNPTMWKLLGKRTKEARKKNADLYKELVAKSKVCGNVQSPPRSRRPSAANN